MRKWQAILSVLLIFLLGVAAGGLVAYAVSPPRRAIEGGPAGMEKFIMERLTRQLDLDTAQREQVRKIVRESQEEMAAVRRQAQQLVAKSEARIREVLTPEQREHFDQIIAERKARIAQWEKQRGPRPPSGPHRRPSDRPRPDSRREPPPPPPESPEHGL
jgi:Spy/CpxP family protein refolding chaperone